MLISRCSLWPENSRLASALRWLRLHEKERALLRRRDWSGLIHYGVIFFMLEKLGATLGVSNLHL